MTKIEHKFVNGLLQDTLLHMVIDMTHDQMELITTNVKMLDDLKTKTIHELKKEVQCLRKYAQLVERSDWDTNAKLCIESYIDNLSMRLKDVQ